MIKVVLMLICLCVVNLGYSKTSTTTAATSVATIYPLVLEFELNPKGIPHLSFYDDESLSGKATYRLDQFGLWDGNTLLCKIVQNENNGAMSQALVPVVAGRPDLVKICQEGEPFYSGYSKYSQSQFFRVRYHESLKRSPDFPFRRYTSLINGKKKYLKIEESGNNYFYDSKISLGSESHFGLGQVIDLEGNGIPNINFYSTPALTGTPSMRLDASGLWDGETLICKKVQFGDHPGDEILIPLEVTPLKNINLSWVDGCMFGWPFHSAISKLTMRPYFGISHGFSDPSSFLYSLPEDVYRLRIIGERSDLYFKMKSSKIVKFIYPQTQNQDFKVDLISKAISSDRLFHDFLLSVQACIKKQDKNCLISKMPAGFEEKGIFEKLYLVNLKRGQISSQIPWDLLQEMMAKKNLKIKQMYSDINVRKVQASFIYFWKPKHVIYARILNIGEVFNLVLHSAENKNTVADFVDDVLDDMCAKNGEGCDIDSL